MLKSGGSILDANPGSDLDAIQQDGPKPSPSGAGSSTIMLGIPLPKFTSN